MNRRFGFVPLATIASIACLWTASGTAFATTGSSSGSVTTTSTAAVSPKATASSQGMISSDQAVAIAKKFVTVPDGYQLNGPSLQPQWGYLQRDVYQVDWNQQPMQPGRPSGFYMAVIDAHTGQVLNIEAGGSNGWSTVKPISAEDAKDKAMSLVKQLAPDQFAELQLVDSQTPQQQGFSFQFVRKVNGITAPFDNVSIRLDLQGNLASYSINWQNAKFAPIPQTSKVVSLDKATQVYEQGLGLHLQYTPVYQPGGQLPNYVLAYQPSSAVQQLYYGNGSANPWVDPVTDQLLGGDGKPVSTPAPDTYVPLVKGGPTSGLGKQQAQPLDQKAADKLARQRAGIPASYTLQSENSGTASGPGYTDTQWNLQYQDSKTNNSISVNVDANTGEMVNYTNNTLMIGPGNRQPATTTTAKTGSGETAKTLTQKQIESVAVQFVKRAMPDMTGAIALAQSAVSANTGPNGSTGVSFWVLQNGIPFTTIPVDVDSSGQVVNFFEPDGPMATLPKPGTVVGTETAKADWAKQMPLQLQYVLPTTTGSIAKAASTGRPPTYSQQAIAVYAPVPNQNGSLLDATTGTWKNLYGQEGTIPTDTAGHSGEVQMDLMAEHGALPEQDGQVHPDATVTRAEFIKMLVTANASYYGNANTKPDFQDVPTTNPNFVAIEQAVYQGWLPTATTFNPDDVLNRLDAATWLVRYLGWGSLAADPGLFATQASDIGELAANEQGFADIAVEQGMIPTVAGLFQPQKAMTVADASVAIVQAIQSRTNAPS